MYPPPSRLDARAWLLWVTAVAILITLLRHPVYVALTLLAIRLVHGRWHDENLAFRLPLWRLAAGMLLFSTLFNALFVHVGAHVLWRLPANWPLVGGAITAEAALVGALNGLVLIALLALFVTFNAIVPLPHLVRLTPGALVDLGLVVLIALTYVPETTRHLRRIRAAQAIRGHRLRGWRDWQPIAIPLLIGGLERSLNIAETMVARGFGQTDDRPQSIAVRIALVAGLAAALLGATLAFWRPLPGWLLMVTGSGALVAGLWWNGRRVRRTTYRSHPWNRLDSAVALTAAVAILLVLWRATTGAPLSYSPYPTLVVPQIDMLIAGALLLLALPAFYPPSVTAALQPK